MNAPFPTRFSAWLLAALILAAGCSGRATREDIRSALREDPGLVLDVLREHPEELESILLSAARAREARRQAARQEAELKAPLAPDLSGDRPALGPADAATTVVAYSDFLCSHCAHAAQTLRELMEKRPGQLRLVYKHLPHSRTSVELALYFEALGRQDPALAWRFHDECFRRQKDLMQDEGGLAAILAGLAPDQDRLQQDLRDPVLAQRLGEDAREAEAFGFDGSPSFVVGGVSLIGARPLAEFERVLDLVLGKRPAAAPSSGEWAPADNSTCADCLQK